MGIHPEFEDEHGNIILSENKGTKLATFAAHCIENENKVMRLR